jgi:hypothetical protein
MYFVGLFVVCCNPFYLLFVHSFHSFVHWSFVYPVIYFVVYHMFVVVYLFVVCCYLFDTFVLFVVLLFICCSVWLPLVRSYVQLCSFYRARWHHVVHCWYPQDAPLRRHYKRGHTPHIRPNPAWNIKQTLVRRRHMPATHGHGGLTSSFHFNNHLITVPCTQSFAFCIL